MRRKVSEGLTPELECRQIPLAFARVGQSLVELLVPTKDFALVYH